jgi:hypothetical protein
MIEIECFQREPSCGIHVVKIWLNGNLAFANEITTLAELRSWRKALHNELLWMNDYFHEKGIKDD